MVEHDLRWALTAPPTEVYRLERRADQCAWADCLGAPRGRFCDRHAEWHRARTEYAARMAQFEGVLQAQLMTRLHRAGWLFTWQHNQDGLVTPNGQG